MFGFFLFEMHFWSTQDIRLSSHIEVVLLHKDILCGNLIQDQYTVSASCQGRKNRAFRVRKVLRVWHRKKITAIGLSYLRFRKIIKIRNS